MAKGIRPPRHDWRGFPGLPESHGLLRNLSEGARRGFQARCHGINGTHDSEVKPRNHCEQRYSRNHDRSPCGQRSSVTNNSRSPKQLRRRSDLQRIECCHQRGRGPSFTSHQSRRTYQAPNRKMKGSFFSKSTYIGLRQKPAPLLYFLSHPHKSRSFVAFSINTF